MQNSKIAVIGLDYVSLPLVVGFDIAQWRIDELMSGIDRTLELSETQVKGADTDEYEAIVLAVAHDEYKNIKLNNKNQVVFDIKSILNDADGRL